VKTRLKHSALYVKYHITTCTHNRGNAWYQNNNTDCCCRRDAVIIIIILYYMNRFKWTTCSGGRDNLLFYFWEGSKEMSFVGLAPDSRTGRRFSYAHTTRPKPVWVNNKYIVYKKPDLRGGFNLVRSSTSPPYPSREWTPLYSIFVIIVVVVVVFTCFVWLWCIRTVTREDYDHRDRKYYNNSVVVCILGIILHPGLRVWHNVIEVWKLFIRSGDARFLK